MSPTTICRICTGPEPGTVDKLLVLGWSPRFIASRWGVSRKLVARHRDRCLTDSERENVKRDLLAAVGRGEG